MQQKNIFVLLLTLTYLMTSEASTAKDTARSLLEKLRKSANAARDEALKTLRNLEQQSDDVARNVALDAQQHIEKHLKIVENEVEKLKIYAQQHNIDITYCMEKYEAQLYNLPKQIQQQIHNCLANKKQTINDVLNIANGNIQKTYGTVNDLQVELEKCGNGITSFFCITKVTAKITYQRLRLPANIKNQSKNTEKQIDKLFLVLNECGKEKEEDGKTQAKNIIALYTKCVYSKA